MSSAQGAGGLGYGFPAALGRRGVAARRAPVLAVSGDGGAMYGIAELATARQHDLPVTWLIVDDGGYGILREYMTGAFGSAYGTELARPDFVALAQAFGVPRDADQPGGAGEGPRVGPVGGRAQRRRAAGDPADVRADPPRNRIARRVAPRQDRPQRSRTSSRTRPASAWPRVAFITAPTTAPAAATLPPRIFSATAGSAASASSTAASSAVSSLTTARPRAAHHVVRLALAGEHALDHLAGQLVVERAGLHEGHHPGDLGRGDRQRPRGRRRRSFACRASSPSHHLRAASAGAPAATVLSTRSTAPALTRDCISRSDDAPGVLQLAAADRAATAGSPARSSSTQAGSGATGTRSGSGK